MGILFRLSLFKYGVASGGVRSSSSVSTRYGVVTPFAFRQQAVFSLPCLDKPSGCVQKPLLRLQSFARSHSEDSAPPPFATNVFFFNTRDKITDSSKAASRQRYSAHCARTGSWLPQ